MLKKLPILFFSVAVFIFVFTAVSHAQTPPTSPITPPGTPQLGSTPVSPDGNWVVDSEVTFVGKTASRSGDFLDWTLRNYDWACVRTAEGLCSSQGNPLVGFWALIRNIVYALLIAVVLIAAFVMIITRGRSITVMRFIPRFILIIVLVTLSYSLIQFIYQMIDIVQGFFLRHAGRLISTSDLIFIGFDYKSFIGYRRAGAEFDESAFITLLLVRLTAITYYVMTGILLIRKIILWFFIILSPVFPLLLFFKPLRNTGKIWIGEFFRWLLYAPLFAIFLNGLVVLWKSTTGIPLAFDFTNAQAGQVIYPTAVNILIGGPGQQISITNSVNLQDTFALYIVALLMLWVVILLPFLLLKIFLDYLGNISFKDNATFQKVWDRGMAPFNPKPPSPISPTPFPPPATSGLAKQLPFAKSMGMARTIQETRNISENRNVSSLAASPINVQILQKANLSIPKMRDIARFEKSMLSKDSSGQQEVNRLKTSLTRIANPNTVQSVSERERYSQVKQQLVSEKQKGNVVASGILSAANTTTRASQAHTPGKQASVTTLGAVNLPVVNKVQQVSLEDYEEVRKMWVETYQNSEPPTDLSGKQESREEWIKGDMDKINQAVTLLSSIDPARSHEGMEMVSNILPFLMVGGFSKTEVIAYLKAKLEAAKQVASSQNQKKEEEESLVDRSSTAKTEQKHMTMEQHAEIPETAMPFEDSGSGQAKINEIRKEGSN